MTFPHDCRLATMALVSHLHFCRRNQQEEAVIPRYCRTIICVDFILHLLHQNYITSPSLDGGWWRRRGWTFRLGHLASGIWHIKQEQCLQSWERRKFQEGDLATKSNVTELEKDELWDETMDLTFRRAETLSIALATIFQAPSPAPGTEQAINHWLEKLIWLQCIRCIACIKVCIDHPV